MKLHRVIFSALLLFGLSACGVQTQSLDDLGEEARSASQDDIAKAYELEVKDILENLDAPQVKAILDDGFITDGELNEVRTNFTKCLEENGFTEISFNADGTYEALPPQELRDSDMENNGKRQVITSDGSVSNSPDVQCEIQTGHAELSSLYFLMRKNPLNEDFDELVLQCLKENEAVEKSMTKEELIALYQNGYGDDELFENQIFNSCSFDPLGVL